MRPTRITAASALPFIALLLCAAPATGQQSLKGPDVCGWLTPAQLQKVFGRGFEAPARNDWPPAFAGQTVGTSCTYQGGSSLDVVLIAYVDHSADEAKKTFEKLAFFFSPNTKVAGIGDEAYIDKQGAIHVLKGKFRYFIRVDASGAQEKTQVQNLATQVAARL